jgi:hypothetical protein
MRPGSMRLFPAILCAPCPPPRLTTFEIRAAVVRQLLQNGVRAGGIAARRSRVPSRWEQAFWARFDAQRATLERAV